jgi:hypothetical protein
MMGGLSDTAVVIESEIIVAGELYNFALSIVYYELA